MEVLTLCGVKLAGKEQAVVMQNSKYYVKTMIMCCSVRRTALSLDSPVYMEITPKLLPKTLTSVVCVISVF